MRRFYYCGSASEICMFENFDDAQPVNTALGPKRADLITGSTKATAFVPPLSGDGGITYVAMHGGKLGNSIRITHETGPEGDDYIDRPLAAARDGLDVIVTYATNGTGDAVTPTSGEVEAVVNGDPDVSAIVVATAVDSGTGEVNLVSSLALMGGLDNGDWRKFSDVRGTCRRVSTVEVV